ncbi:MAG TPA: hypothetical protein VGN83_09835 [Falsiroseomonas sp.]|jgi:GH15 family glucan-1,4-alpha-glucosidase|nr:hypothetical protein [Falsiroseomonas sp.]
MGSFEGVSLSCCFWLAASHAKDVRPEAAKAIVERIDAAAGELGLLTEEMDARTGAFLGNTPPRRRTPSHSAGSSLCPEWRRVG